MDQVSDISTGERGSASGSVGAAGQIDGLYDNILTGWAATSEGEPCEVVVLVNDREIGRIQSNGPRPDVAEAGLSKGLGGWRMPLDGRLTETSNVIAAHFADGRALPGSPITKIVSPPPSHSTVTYHGAIDSDKPPILQGWSLDGEGSPATVTLEMDDEPAIAIAATGPRPDLAAGGVSKGEGGWSRDVSGLLKPGTNHIRLRFPNGMELPGSPIVLHQTSGGPASTEPVPSSQLYRGTIERAHPPLLSGWSVSTSGEPAPITLVINGGAPMTLAADEPRPDLADAGLTNGCGGWSIEVAALADRLQAGPNDIRMRFLDGTEIPGGPIHIEQNGAGSPPRPFDYIGAIDLGALPELKGWSVSWTRDPAPVTIHVNDSPPFTIPAEQPRPDLLATLSKGRGGWWAPIAGLLKPGANIIHVRLPDGGELHGSPVSLRLPGGEPEPTPITPPAPVELRAPEPPKPAPMDLPIPERVASVTPEPNPAASVSPPPPPQAKPMALADFDEISLDDLIDVVASGVFDFGNAEPEEDVAQDAEQIPAPTQTRAPQRPGLLSRLLRRSRKDA